MPDNTSVTEFIFRVAGTADINAATVAMKGADTVAKEHNATVVGGSQAQVAAIGMTRREWMRTGSEASYYLTLAASKTSALGGQVAQVTGLVTQLGESFMYSTGIGMGIAVIGLAVSAAANVITRAQEEIRAGIKATLKPVEDLKTALNELEKPSGGVARALYEVAGVSKVVAELLAAAAEKGGMWRDRLHEIESASRKAAQAELDYAEARRNLEWGTAILITRGGITATQAEADSLTKLGISLENAKWKAYELYWQKRLLIEATAEEIIVTGHAATAQEHYAHMVKQGLAMSQVDIKIELERRATLEQLWKTLQKFIGGVIKTSVEVSITRTEVTEADIKATAAGTYKDKWDEPRRQAEAMYKNGEIPWTSKWTQDMMAKYAVKPEDFAIGFGDFSLFQKPGFLEGYKSTDYWEKLQADIVNNIDKYIGKESLIGDAWDKAWENLMKDSVRMGQLTKLGIRTQGDLLEKLGLKPGGVDIGLQKAADFDAVLASIRESILSNIPPELYTTVYVTYKLPPIDTGAPPPGGGNATRPPGTGAPQEDRRLPIASTSQEDRRPSIIINATVANSMDLERLAYRLGRVYQRR